MNIYPLCERRAEPTGTNPDTQWHLLFKEHPVLSTVLITLIIILHGILRRNRAGVSKRTLPIWEGNWKVKYSVAVGMRTPSPVLSVNRTVYLLLPNCCLSRVKLEELSSKPNSIVFKRKGAIAASFLPQWVLFQWEHLDEILLEHASRRQNVECYF